VLAWVRSGGTDWRQRAGYYLCAMFLFWATVSGRASFEPGRGRPMEGMLRYALPILMLQLLTLTHLLMRTGGPAGWRRTALVTGVMLVCAVGLYCEVCCLRHFVRGGWVA